jgi:hypothetical protein
MADRVERSLRCPSAQPGMGDVRVLGVVGGSADKPRVSYLNETVAATPDILALAGPVAPTEVFRLSSRCEEKKCVHFDGRDCQLAVRIVEMLPAVSESLPPCTIRHECRWYKQEGRAACLRCPQIMTVNIEPDERMQRVAGAPSASAAPGLGP